MTHRNKDEKMLVDDQNEQLKIYDDDGRLRGIKRRADVHRQGDLHYVIHCWVWLEDTDQLLIQKRGGQKAFAANCLDVSCAGHYSADEGFSSTRELEEELGLCVAYDQLDYLFDFEEYFKYGDYKDREIARVHLYKFKGEACFKPHSDEEISEIYRVERKAFLKLIQGRIDSIPIYLDQMNTGNKASDMSFVDARFKDFVKRSPEYYLKLSEFLNLL